MATHDIPRETWQAYFEQFSQTHQSVSVTVETVDRDANPRIEKARPLADITFDPKSGETGVITIQFGTEAGNRHQHTISAPKHVYHKTGAGIISDEVNADEILEITADDHPAITQLQFHSR